jgi:hypothetical protein
MKRRTLILTIAAFVLIFGMSIGSAMAYFTTYVTAQGGKTIHLGSTTEVSEPQISDWTKHVVVTSDEGSQPVYVRAKAFAGSQYNLVYSSADGSWAPNDDGYYYYNNILNGGESTSELLVRIENVPEDTDDFNVVVVYESTPVLYDTAGNPYADWSQSVILDSTEGGQE